MRSLNPRQRRFIDEYLLDLNGARAAVRAGYSPGSARQHAHRLLTDDDIAAEIARRRADLAHEAGVTARQVLDAYARIAFGGLSRFIRIEADGGPVAVWCRSFDHVMCSKGDEPWAQEEQMNFAKMRCGSR